MTGNWKTNVGQSILEEVPVQERHKNWIDAVSSMFGGLAICSLEALVARDGREFIIEVNDCAMGLLGESQEEDRKHIAEVVMEEMEGWCCPPQETSSSDSTAEKVVDSEPDKKAVSSRHPGTDSEGEIGERKSGDASVNIYFFFQTRQTQSQPPPPTAQMPLPGSTRMEKEKSTLSMWRTPARRRRRGR